VLRKNNVKHHKVVGKSLARLDGPERVSGRVRYTADIVFPSMLHARLFRSPIPHGRIRGLDVSRARSLRGVAAVLTADDLPNKKFGLSLRDEEIFASKKVRYIGDVIAAVAAEDEETAEAALDLIECDYEELPAVLNTDEALLENAPLVHEELGSYELNPIMTSHWQPVPGTNIAHQTVHTRGDVDRGFAGADYVFEDTFRSHRVQHCSLEPHAVLARIDGDKVTVWSSTQNVFQVRAELAHLFDLPENDIRVIGTHVGGGFGGKNVVLRVEHHALALALATQRPVRLVLPRKEVFDATPGSVPATIRVKTGVNKDGTIIARAVDFIWDTGAYAEGIPTSNRALKDGIGPYKIPHIRVTSTLVYTNKVFGCPYRGLGIAEAVWANESQMDLIADRLGLDPVQLRLKNCLDQGDETPAGDRAVHIALEECIREVSAAIGWKKKPKTPNRGIGFALLHKSPPTPAASSFAHVRINGGGVIELSVGASDVGGGTSTSLAQIAAEELGVTLTDIKVVLADTGLTPFDHGTFSSRVTSYVGAAVRLAAADAKKQLSSAASRLWSAPQEELCVMNKKVLWTNRRAITFAELLKTAFGDRKAVLGIGEVQGKRSWAGDSERDITAAGWPFGAQAIEVEVDQETGKVKVLRVASAHDVGKAINPLMVSGQIEGGVVMGLGYALYEELEFDGGKVINPTFADYKIHTTCDVPEVMPIIVEKPYSSEPFGAKGVGEVALFGIAPALANAISNAVGIRIKELPITPEKILGSLKHKREEKNAASRKNSTS
jgi:carbon-monoxide dehydrogenase large subunit